MPRPLVEPWGSVSSRGDRFKPNPALRRARSGQGDHNQDRRGEDHLKRSVKRPGTEMWPVQRAHVSLPLEGLPKLCLFMSGGGQGEPCLTDAAPRGRPRHAVRG